MKKKLWVPLLLITSLLSSCDLFSSTTETFFDESKYNEYINRCWRPARYFMPSLSSLTDCTERAVSITSTSYKHGASDVDPYGIILIASYAEDIYETKKEEIDQNYIFVNTPIISDYGDTLMPAIDVIYCEYRIRVVYDNDFYYPSSFGMIGINDNKHSIAYLYYQDVDLDCIGQKNSTKDNQERLFNYILSRSFIFPEQ
ncbi:MAG: hypothetical protein J1F31_01320 [Erysipelotrichales bacterium]|nr:hypothetical protein [Erysipelotrichales bacterium]